MIYLVQLPHDSIQFSPFDYIDPTVPRNNNNENVPTFLHTWLSFHSMINAMNYDDNDNDDDNDDNDSDDDDDDVDDDDDARCLF